MAFSHYILHFITNVIIVLVFLLCVYICLDMPSTFCGWISILVYIYIGFFLFTLRVKGEIEKNFSICPKY
jgi:hypothetical protein